MMIVKWLSGESVFRTRDCCLCFRFSASSSSPFPSLHYTLSWLIPPVRVTLIFGKLQSGPGPSVVFPHIPAKSHSYSGWYGLLRYPQTNILMVLPDIPSVMSLWSRANAVSLSGTQLDQKVSWVDKLPIESWIFPTGKLLEMKIEGADRALKISKNKPVSLHRNRWVSHGLLVSTEA